MSTTTSLIPLTRLEREAMERSLNLLYPQLDRALKVAEKYPEFDGGGKMTKPHKQVKHLEENIESLEKTLGAGHHTRTFEVKWSVPEE